MVRWAVMLLAVAVSGCTATTSGYLRAVAQEDREALFVLRPAGSEELPSSNLGVAECRVRSLDRWELLSAFLFGRAEVVAGAAEADASTPILVSRARRGRRTASRVRAIAR